MLYLSYFQESHLNLNIMSNSIVTVFCGWMMKVLHSLFPSATNADHWEDTGQPVASKPSSTSVFILELKPTSYIYSGQTHPAQRSQRKKQKRRREKKKCCLALSCAMPEEPFGLIAKPRGQTKYNHISHIYIQNWESMNQLFPWEEATDW